MADRRDNAASGLHLVNALRTAQGSAPMDADEVNDEDIADCIANLLHLAAQQELDPEECWDKGWRYYEGDAEEDEVVTPVPGIEAFHGTPVELTPGTILRPGPHLALVHASREKQGAHMWGSKKAGNGPHHVYRVRMSADAVEGFNGVYGTSAEVIEEVR